MNTERTHITELEFTDYLSSRMVVDSQTSLEQISKLIDIFTGDTKEEVTGRLNSKYGQLLTIWNAVATYSPDPTTLASQLADKLQRFSLMNTTEKSDELKKVNEIIEEFQHSHKS